MQRQWDVVRKILLAVEALPTECSAVESTGLPGVDEIAAAYHMRLLLEAGLIAGGCREGLGPAWCHAGRLTWAGHEFLDQIKRETVWHRIKASARQKSIELSFEVIKALADQVIAQMLK